MIKLPPGIEYEPAPIDVRYRSNLRGLLQRIRMLYSAIVERFGDEGLQLIRDVSSEYGREIAAKVSAREGPMDIKQVGMFLIKVFDNMRAEGEVVEFTDDRVAIAVSQCPYPFERDDICAGHTTMEESLVKGLNPELEYFIEESIPRGDARCVHVLRRKKG
jgi:predicted ArsR family transcriptional regulator